MSATQFHVTHTPAHRAPTVSGKDTNRQKIVFLQELALLFSLINEDKRVKTLQMDV